MRFEWIAYVFGALLVWSGLHLLRRGTAYDPGASRIISFLGRHVPTTSRLAGARLLVRASEVPEEDRPPRRPLLGRWYATPLLAVLVVIEATDLVFAIDSIPAIFGVTREPFIVFSATALALLGLRSLYFLLAEARVRFAYLDTGLAVLLVFVGAKFLLADVVEIGRAISLIVIVTVIAIAIAASAVHGLTAGPPRRYGARGGSTATAPGRARRAHRSGRGTRSCRRPAPGPRR